MHYRLWAILGSSVMGTLFLFNAPVQAHDMRPSHTPVVAHQTGAAPKATVQHTAATTVRVNRGDTLSRIAAAHGTTWQNLARINHIANPNLIFPGQVVVISGGVSYVVTPAPTRGQAVTRSPQQQRAPQHNSTPGYSSGGSVQGEISATFGAYAGQALRVAACESGYNPGAVNRSSGSSGVFQFMSATWGGTPYRGQSVFNSSANIHAAYWLFQRDGYSWREWSCKP